MRVVQLSALVVTFMITCVCLAQDPAVIGGVVTPCVRQVVPDAILTREQKSRVYTRAGDGTKWLLGDDDCIQHDKDSAKKLAEVKLSYSKIRLENINLRLELDKRVQQLFQWEKVRYPLWLEQERVLKQNLSITSEQVVLWRTTAERYRAMKTYRPWYEHPIFVATTTALITAGVFSFASWASGGFRTGN